MTLVGAAPEWPPPQPVGWTSRRNYVLTGPAPPWNAGETKARQGIWATNSRRITWIGVGLPMEATPSVAVMGPFKIVKLCLVPLPRGGKEAHGLPDALQRALGNSTSPISSSLQDADELT